jgi:hypothetical protein
MRVAANIQTYGSARETKDGLDSKSGISKFRQAREYRRAAKNAYRFAKVAFAFDISYRVSHYRHRRVYQKEAETKPISLDDRIHN